MYRIFGIVIKISDSFSFLVVQFLLVSSAANFKLIMTYSVAMVAYLPDRFGRRFSMVFGNVILMSDVIPRPRPPSYLT